MRKAFAAVLAVLAPLWARAGEPGASFLAVTLSPYADAVGGNAAFTRGAEALNTNPAFLGDAPSWEFNGAAARLSEDLQMVHAALGRPAGGWPWAASLTYFRVAGAVARDATGAVTSNNTTDTGDAAFALGVARRAGSSLSLGATGRVFRSTLGSYTASTTGSADVGVGWRRGRLALGAAMKNLGPGQKFLSQTDPLPRSWDVHGAWDAGPLAFGAHYVDEAERKVARVGLGLEYRRGPLALRGGYQIDARGGGRDEIDPLSLGFGYQWRRNVTINYAFRQSATDTGAVHRVLFKTTWVGTNAPGKTRRAAAPTPAKKTPPRAKPTTKTPAPAPAKTPSPRRRFKISR